MADSTENEGTEAKIHELRIVLSIRTDKPEAEVGLFDGSNMLSYERWQAHRELSTTIHARIKGLLDDQKKNWHDVEAIVCYKGPGSFTGLRVGLSAANALAGSLHIPIVSTTGEEWIKNGIGQLVSGADEAIALPAYDGPAFTTPAKK